MAFFNAAVGVLQTLVVALGAGIGIWGVPSTCWKVTATIRCQWAEELRESGGTDEKKIFL